MPSAATLAAKQVYIDKLLHLLQTTKDILLVDVDHVGSKSMQQIRIALRGHATILMGKNTLIRTVLRRYGPEYPELNLDVLLTAINGNVGMVFCHDGNFGRVQDVIDDNVIPAAAVAGDLAPIDVHVYAGPTGMDPAQTSFFQALNIATKIVKGSIEIVSDVHLVKANTKVSMSEEVLLRKMGIKPFTYGMKIVSVFQNGAVFDAAVMKITDDALTGMFMAAAANIAAFSREIEVPTEPAVPHMINNAFRNIAGLCADIDFTFEEIAIVKEFLADPSKFASAGAAPAASGAGGAAAAPAAAAVEEEEEEDMEFDLF